MLVALLGLALVAGLGGLVAPSSATPGRDDYPTGLRSHPKDSLVDPWYYYNRECTSFVAWRLNNDNGVSHFYNRYKGHHWGNAGTWKGAAQASGVAVNSVPAPGAVAWWSNSSTSGGLGHVAWVWKVSGNQITIEEYNYLHRGGYDTRTLSKGDRYWPDGFIHVRDLALRNTTRPSVGGTAQVGRRLTARTGSWSSPPSGYAYQWRAGGTAIKGATRSRFTPTADQLGRQITVRVTASASGLRSASATSRATAGVARGQLTNTAAPAITGTPRVDAPLTADAGSWSPGAGYAYQWIAGSTAVPGATDDTFTPGAAQVGEPISVRVTASRAGYATKSATSAKTASVAKGSFSSAQAPAITGKSEVGRTLTVSPGTWQPGTGNTYSYRWLADGKPISGATSTTLQVGPDLVGKRISVRVTVTRPGYAGATKTTSTTPEVARGTFLITTPPSATGTPQVGVEMRGHRGDWSPAGQFAYQWSADGQPITGATSLRFTPTAVQVGKKLSLAVTGQSPGYNTATRVWTAAAPVEPGTIHRDAAPKVTGGRMVGDTLRADAGTWSPSSVTLSYQWRADGAPIAGAADSATYRLTGQDAGHRISVRVTATADGYTTARGYSSRTATVLLGRASFDGDPHVAGVPRPGRELITLVGDRTPSGVSLHYQWYRGASAIAGATGRSHRVADADLGRRLSVRITLSPPDWQRAVVHTPRTRLVRSVPRLAVAPSTSGRNVRVGVDVTAPGVRAPAGGVRVRWGRHVMRRASLSGGRSTLRFTLPRGRHHLTLLYGGDVRVLPGSRTFTVRVP